MKDPIKESHNKGQSDEYGSWRKMQSILFESITNWDCWRSRLSVTLIGSFVTCGSAIAGFKSPSSSSAGSSCCSYCCCGCCCCLKSSTVVVIAPFNCYYCPSPLSLCITSRTSLVCFQNFKSIENNAVAKTIARNALSKIVLLFLGLHLFCVCVLLIFHREQTKHGSWCALTAVRELLAQDERMNALSFT